MIVDNARGVRSNNNNDIITGSHHNGTNDVGAVNRGQGSSQTAAQQSTQSRLPRPTGVDGDEEISDEVLLQVLEAVEKNQQVVLNWPTRGREKVSEFKTPGYFTMAFPALFPTGAGMFHATLRCIEESPMFFYLPQET